jgi:hypothetical protein
MTTSNTRGFKHNLLAMMVVVLLILVVGIHVMNQLPSPLWHKLAFAAFVIAPLCGLTGYVFWRRLSGSE